VSAAGSAESLSALRPAASVGVLVDGADMRRDWERSENHYGHYALELLEHAGVPHMPLSRADLLAPESLPRIIFLPYPLRLTKVEASALEAFVRAGGAVLASGGVEGGDALFGVKATRRYLRQAVLEWPAEAFGPQGGVRVPVWGAQLAEREAAAGQGDGSTGLSTVRSIGISDSGPKGGGGATAGDRSGQSEAQPNDQLVLGEIQGDDGEGGVAALVRGLGQGVTCYLAVDIARSVVTMQQGVPVMGDARSAPDGSAAIQDRLLKTDDGAVIDWQWREETPEGPAFATPYADLLRELLVGALAECAARLKVPVPVKWYWPNALPAIATLSYDTDSNEDADGWAFLETLRSIEVEGTWCVMYPGGYTRELYDAIREYGDEIALHYDGLTSDLRDEPHCGWAWEDFRHQFEWLKRETGALRVVSQKNHVTRFEGWVELFRWVERAGITVDQTKGPSKIGNLGFTFGTAHLWRPMEDQRNDNRLMGLLELPFLTHDMHTSQRRVELRRMLLERVRRHAGIGHFIFHPQRIHEPGMREALADLVAHARELGIPWWTSERIADWEQERRAAAVSVSFAADGSSARVEAEEAPEGLTVLLFGLQPGEYRSAGPAHAPESMPSPELEWTKAFGLAALRVTLPAGTSSLLLSRVEVGAGRG
jgi:hypothetical protein